MRETLTTAGTMRRRKQPTSPPSSSPFVRLLKKVRITMNIRLSLTLAVPIALAGGGYYWFTNDSQTVGVRIKGDVRNSQITLPEIRGFSKGLEQDGRLDDSSLTTGRIIGPQQQ